MNEFCCRACRSTAISLRQVERGYGLEFSLFKCTDCGAISFFPDPGMDYSEDYAADDLDLQAYLELNAAVDWMAVNVMSAIGHRRKGKLLDIGCGYGFSVDAARRLAGWDVLGVDPSRWARAGAADLRLPIIHELIDEYHPVLQFKYDVVHASEVLEHVADPAKFLSLLRSILTPDGVLVLTTPDAAALDADINEGQRMAILSLGAHVVLFTQASLSRSLEKAGFAFCRVDRRDATLVAFASHLPLVIPELNPTRVGFDYCAALLATSLENDWLASGIRFRYFRHAVELGDYAKAAEMLHLFDRADEAGLGYISRAEFASKYRIYAGVALFYAGIVHLNFKSDFSAARECFRLSVLICAEKVRLMKELSAFDQNIEWRSRFHLAFCDELLGKSEAAAAEYRAIRAQKAGIAPADVIDAAGAALRRHAPLY